MTVHSTTAQLEINISCFTLQWDPGMRRQNASAASLACEAWRFLSNLSALRRRRSRDNEHQTPLNGHLSTKVKCDRFGAIPLYLELGYNHRFSQEDEWNNCWNTLGLLTLYVENLLDNENIVVWNKWNGGKICGAMFTMIMCWIFLSRISSRRRSRN